MDLAHFPHLNAALNATSTVLILIGFTLIRIGRPRGHAASMIAATVTSTIFLGCYLYYHAHAGELRTADMPWLPKWLVWVYRGILLPHVLLAMVLLPMVGMTLWRAARRSWDKHRRIAWPTFFVWLYVSVTGVMIYWMLYRLFPALNSSVR